MCLGAALGISKPSALLWFKSDLFTYALGFLMLSMGLTLTFDDFRQVPPRNARTAATPCLLPIPRTRVVPRLCALLVRTSPTVSEGCTSANGAVQDTSRCSYPAPQQALQASFRSKYRVS